MKRVYGLPRQSLWSSKYLNELKNIRHVFNGNLNYYELLNVETNVKMNELKESYYSLSKKYHPDINKDEKATEYFQKISMAYATLSDDKLREEYDNRLGLKRKNNGKSPNVTDQFSKNGMNFSNQSYDRMKRRKRYSGRHAGMFNFEEHFNYHYGKYSFDQYKTYDEMRKKRMNVYARPSVQQKKEEMKLVQFIFFISSAVFLGLILSFGRSLREEKELSRRKLQHKRRKKIKKKIIDHHSSP
ncbi:hypothetical protein SNEBB_011494 [Seison nebaliae]|nr:hypothetical protein SNEBB_011494 [Seison nebaliae]